MSTLFHYLFKLIELGMQEFNSKLSDFGLAKAGPTGDRTHVSTQVMGTHGYAAPEYFATGPYNIHFKHYWYYSK